MNTISTFELKKHGHFAPRESPGWDLVGFSAANEPATVVTGIAKTEQLAFENALELLRQAEWSVDDCDGLLVLQCEMASEVAPEGNYWLVSVRVR